MQYELPTIYKQVLYKSKQMEGPLDYFKYLYNPLHYLGIFPFKDDIINLEDKK